MAEPITNALAEAIADQLGVDMTPDFLVQVALVRYRLFLSGYSVRHLSVGPSRPPAGFVFPPPSIVLSRADRADSGDFAK